MAPRTASLRPARLRAYYYGAYATVGVPASDNVKKPRNTVAAFAVQQGQWPALLRHGERVFAGSCWRFQQHVRRIFRAGSLSAHDNIDGDKFSSPYSNRISASKLSGTIPRTLSKIFRTSPPSCRRSQDQRHPKVAQSFRCQRLVWPSQ